MCGDFYRAAALMYLSPTPLHPFPFENVYSLISYFPPFAPSCFILPSHFPALPTWPEPSTVSTTFSPSSVYSSIKSWIYYVKQNRAMTLCPPSLHVTGLEWIIQPQWLKLASGRKRKLFRSRTIRSIFEWRAVSAFPAALSLSSPSPLAPSHSSHQFTHYHMKKEQILLSCLSFRRTAYKSIWWDWWLKSASFVCCVPLHLHGCGVCIFVSFCGCICIMFVDSVCLYIFQSQRFFCQYISGDYGCYFAECCWRQTIYYISFYPQRWPFISLQSACRLTLFDSHSMFAVCRTSASFQVCIVLYLLKRKSRVRG